MNRHNTFEQHIADDMREAAEEGCYSDDLCFACDQPFDFCECDEGADCGRWDNGRLTKRCSKAGSEECDFECPYRGSLYK